MYMNIFVCVYTSLCIHAETVQMNHYNILKVLTHETRKDIGSKAPDKRHVLPMHISRKTVAFKRFLISKQICNVSYSTIASIIPLLFSISRMWFEFKKRLNSTMFFTTIQVTK